MHRVEDSRYDTMRIEIDILIHHCKSHKAAKHIILCGDFNTSIATSEGKVGEAVLSRRVGHSQLSRTRSVGISDARALWSPQTFGHEVDQDTLGT